MRLSIIIVNYNTGKLAEDCIRSVKRSLADDDLEIIAIDNGWTDKSVDELKQLFPDVRIVCNASNRGFAVGNNQGYNISSGRHVWPLNPDTIVRGTARGTLDVYEKVLLGGS